MAIVKEDCDSFDIMPLSEAEKQGKKVLKTTKIDIFRYKKEDNINPV